MPAAGSDKEPRWWALVRQALNNHCLVPADRTPHSAASTTTLATVRHGAHGAPHEPGPGASDPPSAVSEYGSEQYNSYHRRLSEEL